MKLRSGEAYWLLKNGIINSYPSLRENISCDVLVVGGGITGSLIAFQLCSEGYKVVLIDKRDVSLGSTCATTALLQYEIDEPLYRLIDIVGKEAAADSYKEGIASIKKLEKLVNRMGMECGFENKASCYVAHNGKSMEWLAKEFESRLSMGIHVKWLTELQLWDSYAVNGMGAILSQSGASVDSYRLAHNLMVYAKRHYGLEIYDHTEAINVEYDDRKNYVYTDDSFLITADSVVYATGYETTDLLKDKIVELNSTYACISEPLTTLPAPLSNTIFWDTQDPYLYARSTSDNRIIVGGADEPFKNAKIRDSIIEKKGFALMEMFNELMPTVNIIPDFCWAGTYGVTKDALPYIGSHPDFPRSYFVLGFGGNGITFSIMGMKIISDAMAGRSNRFLEYFKFKR
ncbi:MAG TPA: FAD-binding oxidoreductase [Chryseolinea sp.]